MKATAILHYRRHPSPPARYILLRSGDGAVNRLLQSSAGDNKWRRSQMDIDKSGHLNSIRPHPKIGEYLYAVNERRSQLDSDIP